MPLLDVGEPVAEHDKRRCYVEGNAIGRRDGQSPVGDDDHDAIVRPDARKWAREWSGATRSP